MAPKNQHEPVSVIAISGHADDDEEVLGLIAHEAGHSWTLSPAAEALSSSERFRRATDLQTMAVARGRLDVLLRQAEDRERLATDAAKAWGFTGRAVDGERCIRNTRIAMQEEAAAATSTEVAP